MNSDKQKTLEDLVPPLDLCKEARELIGGKTALVWWYIGNGWVVADRKLSINDNAKYIIPAPTLAELLEMLPHDVHISRDVSVGLKCQKTRDGRYWLTYKTSIKDNSNVPDAEFDANPATAALRLLMKVKGVD